MKPVRVLIWGFGAMGSGMADMLLDKHGVEIAGVCDTNPGLEGKSLFAALDRRANGHPDVRIRGEIASILSPGCADIALLATDSFTKKAFPKLKRLMENKLNVISTAEQMAYPKAAEPELADEIDRLARQNGVSVLGTGINPGLIMDLLVILLTGACRDIRHIRVERINSLSPYGPAVMEEQGVGLSPDEFRAKADSGALAGHVGFHESIRMIADAIGWPLSRPVAQSMEPIVSRVERKTRYADVQPGRVAGCLMKGYGQVAGQEAIAMIHPQQVEPEKEGTKTGDYITISGTPDIHLSITPEVSGGIGTIAMCVNMIPHVINASPGLKTMLDLPVPRAILGDIRDLIRNKEAQ